MPVLTLVFVFNAQRSLSFDSAAINAFLASCIAHKCFETSSL